MKIKKGMIIKTAKEIKIPIMPPFCSSIYIIPPILFSTLSKNTKYEITAINNGNIDLMEIAEGCRHHVSMTLEQLRTEILENSVCLI